MRVWLLLRIPLTQAAFQHLQCQWYVAGVQFVHGVARAVDDLHHFGHGSRFLAGKDLQDRINFIAANQRK